MCHFWAQNGPFALNKFFGVQTIVITLIYLLVLFIVQNFKKFLQQIQSYDNAPFLGPKWTICPKQIFLVEITIISLIYLLAPFIMQILKKDSSSGSGVIKMYNLWAQNDPFPQMRIFFQKTC